MQHLNDLAARGHTRETSQEFAKLAAILDLKQRAMELQYVLFFHRIACS